MCHQAETLSVESQTMMICGVRVVLNCLSHYECDFSVEKILTSASARQSAVAALFKIDT